MKSVVKIRIYRTVIAGLGQNVINFADPLVSSGITGNTGGVIGWVGTDGFTTVNGSGSVEFAGRPQGVLSQSFPNEVPQNDFYNVGFEIANVTAGAVDVYLGSERIGSYTTSGVYDVLWHRTGTTTVGGISFVARNEGGNDFAGSILTSSVYLRGAGDINKKQKVNVENYVPMGYLDTKEDISLAYNWQLSDAANINKSQGAFLKSFELPGSKNNRDILGLTGEDNLTFDKVDIRNKFRADIVVDDNDFISGWLVVKSIVRDQNQVDYQCDFYDSVFGLFDLIQKKKISDIDVSSFDHVVTADNIFKTWEPSRTWNQCYTYPLFHLDGTNGLYTTQDFSPAFYNKYLFNQIILGTNVYGYSISPEADATFSKMLTTPIGKRRTIDTESDGASIFVHALTGQTFSTTANVLLYNNYLREVQQPLAFDDDYTQPYYDPFGRWDTTLFTYNLQNTATEHSFEFVVGVELVSTPSFSWATYTPSLITGTPFDQNNYDPFDSFLEVYIVGPTGDIIYRMPSSVYELPHNIEQSPITVNLVLSGSTQEENLLAGDYQLVIKLTDNLMWFQGFTSTPLSYARVVTVDETTSYFKITPNLGSPIGDNDVQRLNKWLPQVDQSTFINEQMNFFNMFAFEDLNKTIKFITSTELYSDTHVIDWSGKVQWVDNMQPLTDISSSRTILGWKETDDEWNNSYRDEVGDQYGDFIFDNDTDLFNEEEENRSRMYGATPFVLDGAGRVVSAIHSRDLPREHRCILQGDNYYPSGDKIFMQYYDPFEVVYWTFEDNYYWEADLGQGYVNNLGFVSSTPSGLEVGDMIRVEQSTDPIYFDDPTYDLTYNGMATVLALVEPTPGQYVVVINKPKYDSTIVIPGEIFLLKNRSVYRSDIHLDSLSASTIDINWGRVEQTLLPYDIEMTPNCLGNKYYRNRLIQLRDGYLYTVYVDLSLLDMKELLDHVGGKIWIDSLNSYFTLYSVQDFDVVSNKLTKVELLKVVGTDDFEVVVTAEGNETTGGFTTDGNLGSIFQPMPGGTYGTINVTTQYGNYIRGGATFVAGTNNSTYSQTRNIFVAGNNNNFSNSVNNTLVLGNNLNVTESNALYISNYALFTQTRTELYGTTVFSNCGMTIDNVFIGSSGITVGGPTGVTITSTGITINGEDISIPTRVQDGVNTYTGGTPQKPTVNVVSSPVFTSVSATTYYSGSTPFNTILSNILSGATSTYVQPGLNITTGGTPSRPVVSTVSNPSFTAITVGSGVTIVSSGITIQGLVITSGFTAGITGNYLPISGGTLTGDTSINSGQTIRFVATNGRSTGIKAPSTLSGNWSVDVPNADGELALVPKSKVFTGDIAVDTSFQYHMCNTSGGAFYAHLPTPSSLGEQYHFFDQRGSFGSFALTISGGTNRVGPETYLILSADHRSCFVTWNGIGWSPIITSPVP